MADKKLSDLTSTGSIEATDHLHISRAGTDSKELVSNIPISVAQVPSLPASKITTGIFDLARIPAAAMERLVSVADQTARFALTIAQVQDGDSVKQLDNNLLYVVVDDTNLNNASGYVDYSATTDWALITSKPANITDIAAITKVDNDIIQVKAGSYVARTPAQLKVDLSLTKTDVGLSNVQNVDQTNASNISSGTLGNARLPSAISVTSLSGNGSGITALNATQLTTGTVPSARLTGTYSGIDKLQINDVGATTGGVYLGTSNQINSSSTISQSDVYVPLSITTSTDNEPRIMVRNANTASTEIQGIGFTQPNQTSRYANDGASINVKFGPDRFNAVDSQFVFRTSRANIGGLNNLFSFSRNGTLGIGKLDAVYQLELTVDSAGKPNGGSWANSSDERIKKDITPLTGALDKIIQLNGVNFKWKNPKDHADHEGIQGGFLAQNIEEVFPEWVKDVDGGDLDKDLTEDGKIKSLTLPFEFDAYIIEALKELKAENDILKSQVQSLLN